MRMLDQLISQLRGELARDRAETSRQLNTDYFKRRYAELDGFRTTYDRHLANFRP